jgi:hypothetical protein
MGMIGNVEEIVKWLFTQGRDKLFEIKEYKAKRSLTANSYFHKLCQLIAEKNGTSIIEVKNQMISDYGQYHFLENGEIDWSIKSENFNHLRCENVHYQITDRYVMDKGKKLIVYLVMRNSRTYSTAEMARLIDGTVSEAKDLGIETLPPAEIERLKEKWI